MRNAVLNGGPYSEEGLIPFGNVGNEFYPKLDAALHETALNPRLHPSASGAGKIERFFCYWGQRHADSQLGMPLQIRVPENIDLEIGSFQ